ncbi:MAG: sigma-70 family RNA polymerase sigma factor [Planctomycetaceae bacterium]|nr:sigma-70 family RNA polymerase sigma factor [Planctomycetaceae bacterium]
MSDVTPKMLDATPVSMLEQISTCWPTISNPVQFVMRYARAIQKYVGALVRDPHDAEEVAQDFLVKVFDKGFCPENLSRGRFRDYLKAAVRYVAISHLRKRRPAEVDEQVFASLAQPEASADKEWATEWRDCLLERVWQTLELNQQQIPENLFYSVLRLVTDDPKADSETQAGRLAQQLGRPYRADAFRQQLRRARRQFAKLLVDEVRQTLHNPDDEVVEQELIDLDLMPFVREFLKSN